MMTDFWSKLKGDDKPVAYNYQELLDRVRTIAKAGSYIAVAPQPTGSNWLGINLASRQLFGENFLEIPQQYSNQVLSDKELQGLTSLIKELGFRNVIFSGFAPYFAKMIEQLQDSGQLKISVIHHGTFSELGYGEKDTLAMDMPLQLFRQGKLHKFATIRKDVAAFISQSLNKQVWNLNPVCVLPEDLPSISKRTSPAIGVFGAVNFNKNIHNQVCGALLVKNSEVFVRDNKHFGYLHANNILSAGEKNRNEFLALLGSMDINLHLSFSESWGQIAVESLALGVPCLVSSGTNLLDEDEELKKLLTVQQIDSPVAIARKIEEVLAPQGMAVKYKAYVKLLNEKAKSKLDEFLQA